MAIAYLALMLLLIINSSNVGTELSVVYKAAKLERIFVAIFVVDMFVKILFHFNGHKHTNDKFLVSDSNGYSGQTEETTTDS